MHSFLVSLLSAFLTKMDCVKANHCSLCPNAQFDVRPLLSCWSCRHDAEGWWSPPECRDPMSHRVPLCIPMGRRLGAAAPTHVCFSAAPQHPKPKHTWSNLTYYLSASYFVTWSVFRTFVGNDNFV